MELLHPFVASRLMALEQQLSAEGIPFRRRETWRSAHRQAYLFQRGRSRPGALATGTLKKFAEERGLRYLDFPADEWDAEMSDNGVHLNEAGHRLFAAKVLAALGYPEVAREEPPAALRDAIVRKNLLWQQYYRPSNWAFLFGDRQHVPDLAHIAD